MANASDTLPIAHLQPAHRRRDLLGRIAGVAAVAVAVPAAAEDGPDPVTAMAARFDALQRQGNTLAAFGDEAGAEALWSASWRVADACIEREPSTLAGLIEQLRLLGNRLDIIHGNNEDAAAVRIIMAHAAKLAGRAAA